jgi:hypothetical protein
MAFKLRPPVPILPLDQGRRNAGWVRALGSGRLRAARRLDTIEAGGPQRMALRAAPAFLSAGVPQIPPLRCLAAGSDSVA